MYKLQILSSKDFDALPRAVTRGSDISMSLGFADPGRKTAYIRHTAWPELNRYLIDHEFEHLVEEHASDEDENGLRHKSIGHIFRSIINPLNFPDLGPLSNPSKNFLDTSKNNQLTGAIGKGATGLGETALFGPFAGGALNAIGQQKPASYQGGGLNGMFPSQQAGGIPQASQASYGQGFGQQGSFSPSSQGYSGGSGMGLGNQGLGQAGITLGANSLNREQGAQDQRQSGNYFPLRF